MIELARQAGAALLATVNDPASPLGRAAQAAIPIHAEVEQTVSTRTYINTLGVNQLAALRFTRGDIEGGLAELNTTATSMMEYLDDWESHLRSIDQRVGQPKTLVLLGRGPSLASANAGALVLAEAAKFAAIGMQTGEFRHGPLELAGPDLTMLLFDGPPETRELNRRLHAELLESGARAHWIAETTGYPASLPRPRAEGIGLPLAEILPIQLLSIHLGLTNGVKPGKFFRVGKVTLKE